MAAVTEREYAAAPMAAKRQPLTVAYLLFIFPVLSETVVVNELLTLAEREVQLRILSWATPEGKKFYTVTDVQHPFTRTLMPLVAYMEGARDRPDAVVRANLRLLTRVGYRRYADAYRLALRYRMLGNWRAYTRFASWGERLLSEGIQHLHAHFATEATAVAHTLSVLTGIPFSFTAHAHDIYRTPQWLGQKMRAAKFVATVCEANREYLLRTYPTVPPERIQIIRPGVDLKLFSPRPERRSGPFHIVSVGRLVRTKGFVDLVAAAHQLKRRGLQFTCTIVGEGHDRAEVEAAIAEHQVADRVRLLGALPRDRILPILDASDVFVLPCYVDPATGDRDGMPLVLAEAMAKGLPVVSTPVSGVPELVRDGSGLLVPQRDVAALTDAIQCVAGMSEDARRAMGQAGRQIVEREFNLLTETEKLERLFQSR
jgi:colanic acid/amylovoran biosynthesis glycosyltransferase